MIMTALEAPLGSRGKRPAGSKTDPFAVSKRVSSSPCKYKLYKVLLRPKQHTEVVVDCKATAPCKPLLNTTLAVTVDRDWMACDKGHETSTIRMR